MAVDPDVVARRLRAQRRVLIRVLCVSLPTTAVGFAVIFLAESRLSENTMNVVIVPTFLAFAVSWLALAANGVIRLRHLRNMFRPGSAKSYQDDA